MKTSILRPARRAGFVSLLAMAILSAGASAAVSETAPRPVVEGQSVAAAPTPVKIPTHTGKAAAESDSPSIEIIPKPEPEPVVVVPEPEPIDATEIEPVATEQDAAAGAETLEVAPTSAETLEVAPNGDLSEGLLTTARSGIGVPYVWAGSTEAGWDCSGFTSWVYAQHGISLPHSSAAQAAMGTPVSQAEAQVGDLVHWPGHVGIYAGDGKVVDAGRSPMSTTERPIWGNPTFTHIESGS